MDHHHPTSTRPAPSHRPRGRSDVTSAFGDLRTSVADAVETFLRSVAPAQERAPVGGGYGRRGSHHGYRHHPEHRHHDHPDHHGCHDHPDHHGCHDHHDHECEPRCKPETCHCSCCVGDADLVVYVRLGERRIVPIRIENERRREREVKLELSEFTTRGGGDAPVHGGFVTPTTFTLGPCETEDSILVIDFRQVGEVHKPLTDRLSKLGDTKAKLEEEARKLPDVDDCLVAYADLRVEGCDVRPVRIAVALVPRDCGPYEIHCGCGCC